MADEPKVVVAPEEETNLPDVNLDAQQPSKTADKPLTGEALSPQRSIEDELADYRQRLIVESQARENAERQRNEAVQSARQANTNVSDSQWHMLRSAIDARKADMESAKRDYAQALQAGDYNAVAEANGKIAELAAEKKQYEASFAQLEEWRKQPPQQQPPQQQPQQQQIDVVEARARASTPRAAAWIRSHPELARDPATWNKIIHSASYNTNVRQLSPDSPEWIAAIEADLGLQAQQASQQAQQRRGNVAAPPSRTAFGQNGSRASGPRVLTAKQAQAAKDMGMTNEEYWTQLQECIADGSINVPRMSN